MHLLHSHQQCTRVHILTYTCFYLSLFKLPFYSISFFVLKSICNQNATYLQYKKLEGTFFSTFEHFRMWLGWAYLGLFYTFMLFRALKKRLFFGTFSFLLFSILYCSFFCYYWTKYWTRFSKKFFHFCFLAIFRSHFLENQLFIK